MTSPTKLIERARKLATEGRLAPAPSHATILALADALESAERENKTLWDNLFVRENELFGAQEALRKCDVEWGVRHPNGIESYGTDGEAETYARGSAVTWHGGHPVRRTVSQWEGV